MWPAITLLLAVAAGIGVAAFMNTGAGYLVLLAGAIVTAVLSYRSARRQRISVARALGRSMKNLVRVIFYFG